jgi:hypothetical protein
MNYQREFKGLMKRTGLTISELARWFDRPYPTVRCWVIDGNEPGRGATPAKMTRLERGMERLDKAWSDKKLPENTLNRPNRIKYLTELRRQYHN